MSSVKPYAAVTANLVIGAYLMFAIYSRYEIDVNSVFAILLEP
jgi:hypothetical protein